MNEMIHYYTMKQLNARNPEACQDSRRDHSAELLQYFDGLYSYAMSLVHNPTEAEDLVQDTYLRAFRPYEDLRSDSNLKSWLFTILRSVRLNQVLRQRG
jgi:RNA polymerase sigma-70 factor (ECF subfamily)